MCTFVDSPGRHSTAGHPRVHDADIAQLARQQQLEEEALASLDAATERADVEEATAASLRDKRIAQRTARHLARTETARVHRDQSPAATLSSPALLSSSPASPAPMPLDWLSSLRALPVRERSAARARECFGLNVDVPWASWGGQYSTSKESIRGIVWAFR